MAITGFIFLVVEGVLCLFASSAFGNAAVTADAGAAASLRQQADRDRLDGGAGLDRVDPRAGHDPHALGSERQRRPTAKPGDNALFVTVVGRQWWWEYHYDHYDGRPLGFITANELHIPASEDGDARGRFT